MREPMVGTGLGLSRMPRVRSGIPWLVAGILGAAAVGTGGAFLVVGPARADADAVVAAADRAAAENAAQRSRLDALAATADRLPRIQAQIDELLAVAPAEAGLAELVRIVRGAALAAGARLVRVTACTPTPAVSRGGVTLSARCVLVDARGAYPSLTRLLSRLQAGATPARVSGIDIGRAAGGIGLRMTASVSMWTLSPAPPSVAQATS